MAGRPVSSASMPDPASRHFRRSRALWSYDVSRSPLHPHTCGLDDHCGDRCRRDRLLDCFGCARMAVGTQRRPDAASALPVWSLSRAAIATHSSLPAILVRIERSVPHSVEPSASGPPRRRRRSDRQREQRHGHGCAPISLIGLSRSHLRTCAAVPWHTLRPVSFSSTSNIPSVAAALS